MVAISAERHHLLQSCLVHTLVSVPRFAHGNDNSLERLERKVDGATFAIFKTSLNLPLLGRSSLRPAVYLLSHKKEVSLAGKTNLGLGDK